MTIDFYYFAPSAPCRSVQMAAAAVGVELNEIPINIMAGEQLTAEYIKVMSDLIECSRKST